MLKSKISSVKVLFCALLFSTLFISFSSNPPTGRTGAPGDGLCSDCHTGANPLGFDGGITIQNFPTSIVGGQIYSLTATVSNPNGLASLAGFQALVLDNNDMNAGTLSNPGAFATTDMNAGREYVEHNPAQQFSAANDFSWTFDWEAPSGPNGTQITIYAAGNIASGSNGNQDDFIVTTTASGTLMGGAVLEVSAIVENNVLCFNGTDGSATASGSGGTPGYTYQWSNGETTATAINLSAGTSSVTVTDSAMDTAITSVLITEPPLFEITAAATSDIDCNNTTGSAILTAVGGTMPYSFGWPSGNTTNTEFGLTAGGYDITVSDANLCTDSITFSILDNSTPPNADAGPNQVLDCNTTQITLDGSNSEMGPEILYQWTTGNGNILSGDQTLAPLINAAGTYILDVQNSATGCSSISTVQVTMQSTPGLSLFSTDVTCNGNSDGTVLVNVTGGIPPYSYTWSDSTLNGMSNPSGLSSGNYFVTVTDSISCTANGSIFVGEPSALSVVGNATPPSCVNVCDGMIDLTVLGGNPPYTITWSNGANTEDLNNLCSGTYTVTVVDNNNCIDSTTVQVITTSALTITALNTPETCASACDGTIALFTTGGSGNYTYEWQNLPLDSTNLVIGCAGVYSATVTDSNGCTEEFIGEIFGPDSLTLADSIVNSNCFQDCNGSITVTPSGGTGIISYDWSNGETTPTVEDLCAGTYTVTASDQNNCEVVESYTILESSQIEVSETITDAGCFGECNGAITVVVIGGTSPYVYTWENSIVAEANIDNLCAGSYSLTVTDANNCQSISVYTITESSPIINSMSSTNETSAGASDGTATVVIFGDTLDHTFLWSNAGNTPTISDLVPGSYAVTVTNNLNGCVDSSAVVVNSVNCDLTANISGTSVTCFGMNDGTAMVQPMNGTMPYNYSWSSGGSNNSVTGLSPGTVFCTVGDANGCSEVVTFIVDSPDELTGTTSTNPASCFGACDGSISLNLFGGTQPYFIVPNSLNDLCAGTYEIVVTDANNCEFVITEVVTQPAELTASISSTPVSTIGGSDGTAMAQGIGGTPDYSYLWNTGSTAASIGNLTEGTYCVTITDVNNCSYDTCTTVNSSGCQLDLMVTTSNPSCEGDSNGSALAATSGGTAPYVYTWSSSLNQTDTEGNLIAGTYNVHVTDANGCEDSTSFVIIDGPTLTLSIINIAPTSCNGICDGAVELSSPNYAFVWPDGSTGSNRQDLCAGVYSVTASDGTCTDSIEVTITEPSIISLFMSSTDESSPGAADGTASAFPTGSTGNFIFNWSNGETNQMITNLTAGTYCVTVTSDSGCEETDCVNVNLIGCDLAVSISQNISTCINECDGELIASITGGTAPFTFTWSNGVTGDTINGLCSGTYNLTVTDSLGCIAEATGTITEFVQTMVDATIMNWDLGCTQPCDNGSIFLNTTGTGPFNYAWSLDTLDGTNGGSGICPGVYTCTITDGNGCTTVYESPQPNTPDIAMIMVNVFDACFGTCNGQVAFSITGGTPPYQIDTDLPTNFSEVCPGDYFISVIDDNSCLATEFFTVSESMEMTVTIDSIGHATPADDGFINITAGGTGPFTYSWSLNGNLISMMEDPQNLSAGTYNLVMEDVNGCVFETSITVPVFSNTNEVLLAENIKIYPNPASDFLNIKIKLAQSAEVNITLFDVLGNNIYNLENGNGLEFQELINTSNFSSGLYTILIQSEDEYWTEKLIILNQ